MNFSEGMIVVADQEVCTVYDPCPLCEFFKDGLFGIAVLDKDGQRRMVVRDEIRPATIEEAEEFMNASRQHNFLLPVYHMVSTNYKLGDCLCMGCQTVGNVHFDGFGFCTKCGLIGKIVQLDEPVAGCASALST